MLFDAWDKLGDFYCAKYQSSNVREGRKVAQVSEHALRTLRSRIRWAMIICVVSDGRLYDDACVVDVPGGVLLSRRSASSLP